MNSEEFVEAIKLYVMDAAVESTIQNLKDPPGKGVPAGERARSDWYNALAEKELDHVNAVISTAVHGALFGLFAVLDGVRTIDHEKGRFELYYVGEQRVLLNSPDALMDLHDRLNAVG